MAGHRVARRVALILALVGTSVVGPSAPASAVTCPVVDPVTHAVTPAPVTSTDWSGCDLRGAVLSGAMLRLANLSGADLTGADLSGANVRQAKLTGADLTGADFGGADLTSATITSATVTGADLGSTVLSLLSSGSVVGAPAVLPAGFWMQAGFLLGPGVSLARADIGGLDLSGRDLHGVSLYGANARGIDLSGTNLSGAQIGIADLRDADLTGADLTGATETAVVGTKADLSGATISGAVLTGAAFKGWLGTGVVGNPAAPGPCAVTAGSLLCSTGMLRVVTSPAVPSVIAIDNALTDMWGIEWMKKATGSHTVCFGAVEGWTAPPCQTVDVGTGAITSVTGTFVQNGFLQVTTSPAVASRISIDGIPRDNWGVYTDLPTGSHEVCFGPVPGYLPPPCQTVDLGAGTTTAVTGTFTPSPGAPGLTGVGLLRVTTSPATPSQITVDGNVADTWGLDWLQIEPGQHTCASAESSGPRRVAGPSPSPPARPRRRSARWAPGRTSRPRPTRRFRRRSTSTASTSTTGVPTPCATPPPTTPGWCASRPCRDT